MEINPPARLSPVSWVSPFCLPSGTAGWSLFRSTTFLKEGPLLQLTFHPAPRWAHLSPSEPAHILPAPPRALGTLPGRFSHEMLNPTRQGPVPVEAAACAPRVPAVHPAAPVPPARARRPVLCHQHGTRRAQATSRGVSLCQARPPPVSPAGRPSAGPCTVGSTAPSLGACPRGPISAGAPPCTCLGGTFSSRQHGLGGPRVPESFAGSRPQNPHRLEQARQALSVKGRIVNVLGFAGQIASWGRLLSSAFVRQKLPLATPGPRGLIELQYNTSDLHPA